MSFKVCLLGQLLFFSLLTFCSSEKILFLFPFSAKSHTHVFEPLITALASRGHDLTIITPFASNKRPSNVKELSPIPGENFIWFQINDPFGMRKAGKFSSINIDTDAFAKDCDTVYENPEFQKILNQKYDVVIMDAFMNTCFDGVLYKIGAPHILICTQGAPSLITQFTGNYLPSSFVPTPFSSVQTDRMTFFQRLTNFLGDEAFSGIFQLVFFSKFEAIYRRHLGEDTPGISEIHKANLSLILMNSHFSMNFPRPNLPDNVEVGGMHCRPAQPLPADLEAFVSARNANHGFIYFSFGSIVQGKNMPEKYRRIFIKVFGKLKQRVLWKWETEDMPDLPSNVKLSKWIPQQDVLGHSNIKLFMTHSGLLSTQEAVYYGVPILGIPILWDQDMNAEQAEAAGFGVKLEVLEMTEELLEEKLNTLLNDTRYTVQAKAASAKFRDQLETPIERAVYWVEYVMRHKGARHLRSAARDLNYFQIHSVDVLGFLLITTLVMLYVFKCTCIKCGRYIFNLGRSKNWKDDLNKKTK